MQKRVVIIHGWEGYPKEGWFPWLKKELESKDFQVQIPSMPNPEIPKINSWVSYLSRVVEDADQNTFLVGHSIGCQTILRYLENLPANKKIGGAVFVAGWFTLMNLKTEEEKQIAEPWLSTPIDYKKVKLHTKKLIAIFSDNDDVVPQNNKQLFEKNLNAKTFLEHNKGHFSGSDNVKQLPIALENLLEISK